MVRHLANVIIVNVFPNMVSRVVLSKPPIRSIGKLGSI